MDLITGTSSSDDDRRERHVDDEYIERDATPGGTPIPQLHGPAAEPVEPIRTGPVRWATRVVPAVGGAAAAITWAVLRARRR